MSAVLTLGLVRIGAVELAIPGDAIEEVVRGPVELSPFPHAPLHVLGAFALRGRPIPTIDLAALVRRAGASADRPFAFALVLRQGTSRFAIQVDEVIGVTRAAPDQVTVLESRMDGGLFSRVYTPPAGGRIAAVLDLDTVLAIEGVKTATRAGMNDVGRDAGKAGTRPVVLFRVGGACLGIEASHVREVQTRPRSLDSPLDNTLVEGFQNFRGINLPVVKLERLLKLPAVNTGSGRRHLVFVEHDGLAAALGVDEIVAIESIDLERLHPVSAELEKGPDAYLGSHVSSKQGVVLALNAATIMQEIHCGGRAVVAEATDESNPAKSAAAAGPAQFLVYRCGGVTMATAITELEAVMELPKGKVAFGDRGDGVTGVCQRFGEPVKLVDLAAKFGLPASDAAGAVVLCVKAESGLQGFLIDRAEALQSAVPQVMPWREARLRGSGPGFTQMIRVRTADSDRAACVLSLAQVANSAA